MYGGRASAGDPTIRVFVYAGLAVFVLGTYLLVVVLGGAALGVGAAGRERLAVLSTIAIAIGFEPVRVRLERLVRRITHGGRATPYEVLSGFFAEVAGAYEINDVLPRICKAVADGTDAISVALWLDTEGGLRLASQWPVMVEPPATGLDGSVAIRHGGERLGVLRITLPPGAALSPVEHRLIDDVAAQSGPVLRNVRLTADLERNLAELSARADELRVSRQRIVAAQDAERRRIERDIHDGAQQHLVALSVQLRLAHLVSGRDPSRARAMLPDLRAAVQDALTTLGGLARGSYPRQLAEEGLPAAIAAQGRRLPLPVRVLAAGVGRYSADLEAAVYFCCLEALQNVVKYADASSATVRLDGDAGELRFTIMDDGRGFDPMLVAGGSGLANMADRIEARGGRLETRSAPGRGTTVSGRLPALEAPVPA